MCTGMVKKNASANAANEGMLAKDERGNLIAFGISIALGIAACVVSCLIHGVGIASMCWGELILFGVSVIAYAVYGVVKTVKGDESVGMLGKVLLGAMFVSVVFAIGVAFANRIS